MKIRLAQNCDVDYILKLLYQVQEVHAKGRPDIFILGAKKYSKEQLLNIIKDENTPIYVATNEKNEVLGYAFCIIKTEQSENLQKIKTLYIDDLCVDKNLRRNGVGIALFNYVKNLAKSKGCYNITLNVWALNEGALKFYQKCGLAPLKTTMETII